ncbi:hypothetical protein CBM2637_B130268 [Cupriavidus taiwanensis]|nr:hypothetical protein CBM2637_B130268 [Cupriavidus taiwanensis]
MDVVETIHQPYHSDKSRLPGFQGSEARWQSALLRTIRYRIHHTPRGWNLVAGARSSADTGQRTILNAAPARAPRRKRALHDARLPVMRAMTHRPEFASH